MSKSLGNYIGINEDPKQIFGKLMSISDELMWRYFELLSLERSAREIGAMRAGTLNGVTNPRDCKIELALELVARFHGRAAADAALADFRRRFQHGQTPDDMPELELSGAGRGLPVSRLLKEAGLAASTSEAIRLVKQGGVRIDGERVDNPNLEIAPGKAHVFQVGKRKFARIAVH
jgi:tyrosyl-tRNA synthetase